MSNYTFGCDPEFFSVYSLEGTEFVASPAILNQDCNVKIIGGDKKHPVFLENKTHRWIMDGVAWELNLKKPFSSMKEMHKEVKISLEELQEFISKIKHPELGSFSLFEKPTVNINPGLYLPRMENETIYQGFIFGCDADEDAILQDYECKEVSVTDYLYRHGGGHIHMGNNEAFDFIRPFVQFCAITLGNFCLANSLFPKEDSIRVNTYGKAGRYRPQSYGNGKMGVEYRSPSNAWCALPEEKIEEMEYWAEKAFEYLKTVRKDILQNFLEPTTTAIASADFKACSAILSALK